MQLAAHPTRLYSSSKINFKTEKKPGISQRSTVASEGLDGYHVHTVCCDEQLNHAPPKYFSTASRLLLLSSGQHSVTPEAWLLATPNMDPRYSMVGKPFLHLGRGNFLW